MLSMRRLENVTDTRSTIKRKHNDDQHTTPIEIPKSKKKKKYGRFFEPFFFQNGSILCRSIPFTR